MANNIKYIIKKAYSNRRRNQTYTVVSLLLFLKVIKRPRVRHSGIKKEHLPPWLAWKEEKGTKDR